MDRNEILNKARDILSSDETRIEAGRIWKEVEDDIIDRADGKQIKPKVFEVRHEIETARIAFLKKIAENGTIREAEYDARGSVGLS